MNRLIKNTTTYSYIRDKSNIYKNIYCKLYNIDTVLIDNGFIFSSNNGYNKYLKNIIIDNNNITKGLLIDIDDEMNIENISFNGYKSLNGITIPLEILEKDFDFSIFISANISKMKKINILKDDKVDEINLDGDIYNCQIITSSSNEDEKIIKIIISYNNNDEKIITYDKNGNNNTKYIEHTIKNDNENNLDLRTDKNTDNINYNKNSDIDTLTLTPNILKEKNLINFKDILVNKLLILSDNNMKLNPTIFEANNVKLNIINNIIILKHLHNNNESYIYIDDNNKLNIIEKEDNKKYKFLYKDNITGVIIKYKKELKFDLIINNKKYHINKIFINWFLNNKSRYDRKIIPQEFSLLCNGNENIYDYNVKDYKFISDYIFETLLEEIIELDLADNFRRTYNDYIYYLKHLNNLLNKGFSKKALIYLHQNGYDNITGIKNNKYRKIESKEEIDTFNNLGKKLIKRRDNNESK